MKMILKVTLPVFVCAMALVISEQKVSATPYASGITNNNGVVSFYLNESADSVVVTFNGGSSTNMGARAAGKHQFNLGTASTYSIAVTKNAGAGYRQGVPLQISDDANALMKFNSPRGVAVNNSPKSPYFGRIYVANSAAGTRGDGIYILNPDLTDAVGQGSGSANARTAGLTFGTNTSASTPWRVEVGEDGLLYISDFADATGNVYVTDPNVLQGSDLLVGTGKDGAPIVPPTHGTIPSSAIAIGSLALNNLKVYTLDGNVSPINGLREYNIGGTALPANTVPTVLGSKILNIVGVTCDMDRGQDGKFYLMQNRTAGNEPGLYVLDNKDADADGFNDLLWDSLSATRSYSNNIAATDILKTCIAVKVSPDGQRVALMRVDNAVVLLNLTNGVPDINTVVIMPNTPTTGNGRDMTFDAAGNLYTASSGQGLVRVFSPGGYSKATTTSDGAFTVEVPRVNVSVTTTKDTATEAGQVAGQFSINLVGDLTQPTVINFTMGGSASNGVDYIQVPASTVIFPGATNTLLSIVPKDDTISELTEDVTITIQPSTSNPPDYAVQAPLTARLFIVDNDPTSISVSQGFTNAYEGSTTVPGTFVLTRAGKSDTDVLVNFSLSGTATRNNDYTIADTSILIPAGATNVVVPIYPVDDNLLEGTENVTLTITSGTGYVVGTPSAATIPITDDEKDNAQVLFSDNFDTDTSANWRVKFGAKDGVSDYSAEWAYDYSFLGLPPAPGSPNGSTKGLKVSVNKNDPGIASAGLNLYPIGQSFSGSFALRFNLFISVGTTATTEHTIFGINHSGSLTNRTTQNTDPTAVGGDGLWFAIVGDASGLTDYGAYQPTNATAAPKLALSRNASSFTGYFPSPPYYGSGGSPSYAATSQSKGWVDVDLSQVGSLITLKVNQATIMQYTNTTSFTSGDIMIGYNDQFDSVGSIDSFAIFDNVRVVKLADPVPTEIRITSIKALANDQVQIDFTANNLSATAKVISSANVTGGYTEESALITVVSTGVYRTTVVTGGAAAKFYRIKN